IIFNVITFKSMRLMKPGSPKLESLRHCSNIKHSFDSIYGNSFPFKLYKVAILLLPVFLQEEEPESSSFRKITLFPHPHHHHWLFSLLPWNTRVNPSQILELWIFSFGLRYLFKRCSKKRFPHVSHANNMQTLLKLNTASEGKFPLSHLHCGFPHKGGSLVSTTASEQIQEPSDTYRRISLSACSLYVLKEKCPQRVGNKISHLRDGHFQETCLSTYKAEDVQLKKMSSGNLYIQTKKPGLKAVDFTSSHVFMHISICVVQPKSGYSLEAQGRIYHPLTYIRCAGCCSLPKEAIGEWFGKSPLPSIGNLTLEFKEAQNMFYLWGKKHDQVEIGALEPHTRGEGLLYNLSLHHKGISPFSSAAPPHLSPLDRSELSSGTPYTAPITFNNESPILKTPDWAALFLPLEAKKKKKKKKGKRKPVSKFLNGRKRGTYTERKETFNLPGIDSDHNQKNMTTRSTGWYEHENFSYCSHGNLFIRISCVAIIAIYGERVVHVYMFQGLNSEKQAIKISTFMPEPVLKITSVKSMWISVAHSTDEQLRPKRALRTPTGGVCGMAMGNMLWLQANVSYDYKLSPDMLAGSSVTPGIMTKNSWMEPCNSLFGSWAVNTSGEKKLLSKSNRQRAMISLCSVSLTRRLTIRDTYFYFGFKSRLRNTFASKVAATQDQYADASIGNVTGSNAVNVFLGIGVAWSIAAIYHAANGEQFRVSPGTLAFSVTLFTIFAFINVGVLLYRRRPEIG
ncbi:sodium/calcium exchanger 1, partial [Sigmodon hispidus]